MRLYQSELFVAGFGYLSDGGVSDVRTGGSSTPGLTRGSAAIAWTSKREAFVLGFVSSGDPNPAPVWFSKSQSAPGVPANGVGYVNPELDKAVDDGRLGPDCSLTARKRAYDVFNRILNEDQPYNFLFWQNSFVVTSSRVRGLVPGTYVPLPDAHLWWLAPQR